MIRCKTMFPILLLWSISFFGLAQEKAKHFKELQGFLPDSPVGFTKSGDPEGASLDMGEMSYSMAEQGYEKGDARLEIVITDYKDAAIMLQQQTMAWNMEYEDTESIARSFEYKGHKGWETFQKTDGEAGVFLMLSSRFMVYVRITGQTSTDQAKEILGKIDLEKLAK